MYRQNHDVEAHGSHHDKVTVDAAEAISRLLEDACHSRDVLYHLYHDLDLCLRALSAGCCQYSSLAFVLAPCAVELLQRLSQHQSDNHLA